MTKTATELEVDVQFGGVSIGDETARVGIKIDRALMQLDQADEILCGKRLTGRIEVCAPGEQQGQRALPGMKDERPHLDGTFDVKRFGVSLKEISAGLTFGLGSIDVSELAKFAKKNGRLLVTDAQFLPEDSSDDDDHEPTYDDHEDTGPQPKSRKKSAKSNGAVATDEGSKKSIFELVKFGMTHKKCELVAEACGGSTIGKFEAWMRRNEFWHRDIKGFGEEWITKLQDAHLNFRAQYPYAEEPTAKALEGRELYSGPSEAITAAYKAGCEAATDGRPASANPHEAGSARHTAWKNGFEETNK